MGIEISGNGGRPPHETADTSKSRQTSPSGASTGSAAGAKAATGGDAVHVSNQANNLQALEAHITNLPVVDTQRVNDVQRTLATGAFRIEPAQVADKLLKFEAGLSEG